jgi:tetratricopeptide (TPR) repeat protein
MRATAVALLTLACSGAVAVRTMPAVAAQAITYRQIVDRYRASPNDGVERMLALSDEARRSAIDQAVAASGAEAWSWDELAAAVMMHTDAGLYFLAHQQPGVPYLNEAERLLARAIQVPPARSVFARRWYAVMDSVLKGMGDTANAKSFAAHFADRFKDSPQRARALAAYHRGVFAEYDGCLKGEFLNITGLTERGGNLVQRYFVPAAREFDSALALDPEMLEAALHLGRVRMLEGRDADARRFLQAAAGSPSRSVAYLAHLFNGSFAERASQWDEAESAYRAAVALFPAGQSASISLAQLLDRRGRAADASRVVTTLLAPSVRAVDPWWLYFEETGQDNGSRIAMLRAEVLR